MRPDDYREACPDLPTAAVRAPLGLVGTEELGLATPARGDGILRTGRHGLSILVKSQLPLVTSAIVEWSVTGYWSG